MHRFYCELEYFTRLLRCYLVEPDEIRAHKRTALEAYYSEVERTTARADAALSLGRYDDPEGSDDYDRDL